MPRLSTIFSLFSVSVGYLLSDGCPRVASDLFSCTPRSVSSVILGLSSGSWGIVAGRLSCFCSAYLHPFVLLSFWALLLVFLFCLLFSFCLLISWFRLQISGLFLVAYLISPFVELVLSAARCQVTIRCCLVRLCFSYLQMLLLSCLLQGVARQLIV